MTTRPIQIEYQDLDNHCTIVDMVHISKDLKHGSQAFNDFMTEHCGTECWRFGPEHDKDDITIIIVDVTTLTPHQYDMKRY